MALWTGSHVEAILSILAPGLGPLACASSGIAQLVQTFRLSTRTLVISGSSESEGFAGLLQFNSLQKIILEQPHVSANGVDPHFDADWFWLLVDRNHETLVDLKMRSCLRGEPSTAEVPECQTFGIYLQHLYRCRSLTSLDIELCAPANFWPGRLFELTVRRLRQFALRINDYFVDDALYLQFSKSLAQGAAFMGNLTHLSLQWRSSEGPTTEDNAHPYLALLSTATLPSLLDLALSGPVRYALLQVLVGFLNRHRQRLARLQIFLKNMGEMHGVRKLLQDVQPMDRLEDVLLPVPYLLAGTDFASVTLDIPSMVTMDIPSMAHIFPSARNIALIYHLGFSGKEHLLNTAKYMHRSLPELFSHCPQLQHVLELPAMGRNLPFEGISLESTWTGKLKQATASGACLANCALWTPNADVRLFHYAGLALQHLDQSIMDLYLQCFQAKDDCHSAIANIAEAVKTAASASTEPMRSTGSDQAEGKDDQDEKDDGEMACAIQLSQAEAHEQAIKEEQEAYHQSEHEAIEKEQQDLTEALLRSKTDTLANRCQLLRLSGCSAEIASTLRASECLAHCFARFDVAGPEFEPQPEWAHGALLLVPVKHSEVEEAELELRAHHIIALPIDKDSIHEALAAIPKRRRRPKITADRQGSAAATDGSIGDINDVKDQAVRGQGNFQVVVEKTFVTVRSWCSSSGPPSRGCYSAPAVVEE